MRKLLLGVAIATVAGLTGLLLASIFLKQECPDCGARTRHFTENPSQVVEGPAILDCPRCGDSGRVSLLNGRLSPPDPLLASLLRNSHRLEGRTSESDQRELESRVEKAGLRTVVEKVDINGSGRFVREEGRTFVLFIQQTTEAGPTRLVARVFLFSESGELLDAVRLTAFESISRPVPRFVIPVKPGGPCVDLRLLIWGNLPPKAVEIHHAGNVWKGKPDDAQEKLGQMEWSVHLQQGRLKVRDAKGKSLFE